MYIYNNIYDYKYNIHTCRCMYEDYIYLDLRVVSNFWVYPVLIHSHVFSRMCFCPFVLSGGFKTLGSSFLGGH